MASFADLEKISNDSNFQSRVAYAMQVAAVQIYNESTSTSGHISRAVLSTRVLNGDFNIQSAAAAVLTNPTIASAANPSIKPGFGIQDGDIQFTVGTIWNAIAGA